MARPRGRTSKNQAAAATTKITPLKRAASPVTPVRQSKRITSATNTSGSKSTPKKSIYFEPASEDESEIENEESGYEDQDQSAVSSPEPSEDESEGYDSEEEEEKPRRRSGGRSKGKPVLLAVNKAAGTTELWKEGVTVDGDGEVFIKLPKARSPGKTPYKDDSLHPNTLLFLGDLKRNNNRAWLKVHDPDFRQSERDFKSFVECLTEKLIEKDETIPELPAKDVVFRIYRDIRFSKDPTPYKTHFSVAWSRTGRKGPYAAYYVQIAPGNSFVGGGLWCPEAAPLALLREAMDRRSQKLKNVLLDAGIRKHFLSGVGVNEKKAVKAFCDHNSSNALKRHPKVYSTIADLFA